MPPGNHLIGEGTSFSVVFDREVVSDKMVGREAEEGFLRVKPALKFKAVWTDRNVLSVTPQEKIPFRAVYDWSVEKGSEFLDGKRIPDAVGRTEARFGLDLQMESEYPNKYTRIPEVVLMELTGEVPLDEVVLKGTFFEEKGTGRKIAASVASLTMAKYKSFSGSSSWLLDNRVERTVSAAGASSPETEIPAVVVISPAEPLSIGREWLLVVPNVRKDAQGKWLERRFDLGKTRELEARLFFDPSGQSETGPRVMELRFNLPLAEQDAARFFRESLSLEVEGEKAELSEDGSTWTAVLPSREEDASGEPETLTFSLNRGNGPPVFRKSYDSRFYLPVYIRGRGAFVCKVTLGDIRSIDGQVLKEGRTVVSENIKEAAPSLYMDAGNNGILSSGARRIQVSSFHMDELSVSAKRIAPNFGIKTLGAYDRYYGGNRAGGRTASARKGMDLVPFELLASEEEEVSKVIPCTDEYKGGFSLDDLFGRRVPPGMYFVEVQGRVIPSVLDGYNRFGRMDEEGRTESFGGDSAHLAVQSVVQVTDLGLLWKNVGGEVFGYVYSLSTGAPVEEGAMEFIREDGKLLGSTPLRNGVAYAPVPKETKYLRAASGRDSYIVEREAGDAGISLWAFPVRQMPYYWRWIKKDYASYTSRNVFFFTDRGIYRPGEEFHLKGIVRGLKGNEILPPPDGRGFLCLKNPEGDILATEELKLSDHGTFEYSAVLPAEKTGNYTVSLYFPRDGKSVYPDRDSSFVSEKGEEDSYYEAELDGESRFFFRDIPVQEFKRNEFEVNSSLSAPPVAPAQVKVATEALAYTGLPLSGVPVEWTLVASPVNFYPERYRDYYFGDHREYDPGYWRAYYQYDEEDGDSYGSGSDRPSSAAVSGKGVLDASGKASSGLNVPQYAFPTGLSMRVTSNVTGKTEQSVRDIRRLRSHPSSLYVGLRPGSRLGEAGSELRLGAIAVGLDGKPYSGTVKAKMTVERKNFSPVRYASEEGTTVRNESARETVCVQDIEIGPQDSLQAEKGGRRLSIPGEKPGIYEVTVSGRDDGGHEFRTAVRLWVYGGGTSPWEYREGLSMKLIPDKSLYRPGETAKIMLETPIEGEVVVTVEREKVLRCYSRRVTLDNNVVEVPIEAGDAPNVYVSVFLVKGARDSARSVKEPQLKLGYCALNVDPVKSRLAISLKVPEKSVRPGSKMQVSGRVLDHAGKPVPQAEVTLYAVDEGVLDVVGYRLPDPLSRFFAKRPLCVQTFSMLTQLLSEDLGRRSLDNKGIFVGGGDGSSSADPSLVGKLRENFQPCALWLGSLKTDADGFFRADYENPDTLTRYRVMAVAVAGNSSFGAGQSRYVVNKPVMLEPQDPVFACKGDVLTIPVTLSRTTDRQGKWKVSLKTDGKVEAELSEQLVDIPSPGMATADFKLKFVETGTAELTWSVVPADDRGQPLKGGDAASLTDAVKSSFDIIYPSPLLRGVCRFALRSGIPLTPETLVSPELRDLEGDWSVSLSMSPVLYGSEAVSFLLQYPYGCLEQTSSKLIPWIYGKTLSPFVSGFGDYTPEKAASVIQAGANRILTHQTSGGSLSYWSDGSSGYAGFTPYAALVLQLAQEAGARLPQGRMDRLYQYLEKITAENTSSDQEYLAAWVLSRAGRLPESRLNRLMDKEAEFDKLYRVNPVMDRYNRLCLAMALLNSKRLEAEKKALALMDNLAGRKPVRGNFAPADTFVSDTLPALELIARAQTAPDSPETLDCLLKFVRDRQSARVSRGYGMSTWTGGWDTMALGMALASVTPPSGEGKVSLSAGNGKREFTLARDGKPVSFLAGKTDSLTFDGSEGTAYGELSVQGRSRGPVFDGVLDKGLVIARTYEKRDEAGNWAPSREFQVGDIVRVTLDVAREAPRVSYLAVEDCLPSAFTPLNPELVSQNGAVAGLRRQDCDVSRFISHAEFLKDRVRFFANAWSGSERFRASYLVRVVRAGSVTAPCAKAELMYSPEVYGLSNTASLTIRPRS